MTFQATTQPRAARSINGLQALAAQFPQGSRHASGAHVLLRVRAKGCAWVAEGGRWAVESVMAERVLRYVPVTSGDKFLDYGDGSAFAS